MFGITGAVMTQDGTSRLYDFRKYFETSKNEKVIWKLHIILTGNFVVYG